MVLPGQVTNLEALETRDVIFTSDGFSMKGYFARPKAPGEYPGVVVLHEAFGLVEHERDVTRRFANAGFMAMAPDAYSRVGAAGYARARGADRWSAAEPLASLRRLAAGRQAHRGAAEAEPAGE